MHQPRLSKIAFFTMAHVTSETSCGSATNIPGVLCAQHVSRARSLRLRLFCAQSAIVRFAGWDVKRHRDKENTVTRQAGSIIHIPLYFYVGHRVDRSITPGKSPDLSSGLGMVGDSLLGGAGMCKSQQVPRSQHTYLSFYDVYDEEVGRNTNTLTLLSAFKALRRYRRVD